ncbi:hypothetical protein DO62_5980 [Burkholderia pseudomallei]|nr:hypothetical protein DO62_5980 [Burkholderia pseudomallei]
MPVPACSRLCREKRATAPGSNAARENPHVLPRVIAAWIPGRSARAPRAPPAASSPASANAPALPPHAAMSRPVRATRRRPPRAARKAIMESFPGGIFPYAARIARLAARRSVPLTTL